MASVNSELSEWVSKQQDNLKTHTPASFYKVFKPSEAFALTQKFEMSCPFYKSFPSGCKTDKQRHYTPKKASWLNMAEIELSALSKQCLDRRIGECQTLEREVKAWALERNRKEITVNWQFTNQKAREKFSRFYPNLS